MPFCFSVHVTVDVSEAGKGDIDVEITNGRIQLPVRFTHDKGVYTIHTKAKEAGTYVVNIRWDGEPITGKLVSR